MTMTEQGLTGDYLDLPMATVDTPDATYQRFRFLFADGTGHLIARSGHPVTTAAGTLTLTGPHSWRLDTADGPWLIDRTKGCTCAGQPIIPKAR